MNLKKIMEIQKEFDSIHGWTPQPYLEDILLAINKDIIGIVGELGEFSNQIKKLNLISDSNKKNELQISYNEKKENLSEEIVDTFIYIIRLASHLEIDLEQEYLKKLEINKVKFKEFIINNE